MKITIGISCLLTAVLTVFNVDTSFAQQKSFGGGQVVTVAPAAYPESESRAGHEGNARVSALVRLDGSVTDVKLLRTSGWPELDKAAVVIMKRTKFSFPPAGKTPTDQKVELELRFDRAHSNPLSSEEFQRVLKLWNQFVSSRRFVATFLADCEKAGTTIGNAVQLMDQYDSESIETSEAMFDLFKRIYVEAGRSDSVEKLSSLRQTVKANADQQAHRVFGELPNSERKGRCVNQVSTVKTEAGSFKYQPAYFAFANWNLFYSAP